MIHSYVLKILLMLLCFIIILILGIIISNLPLIPTKCQNYLPFLDRNANWRTNCFDISVYRKILLPAEASVFLVFDYSISKLTVSKHFWLQLFQFVALIKIFMKNLYILRNFFKSNGYPINLLENCINNFFDRKYSDLNSDDSSPLESIILTLKCTNSFFRRFSGHSLR